MHTMLEALANESLLAWLFDQPICSTLPYTYHRILNVPSGIQIVWFGFLVSGAAGAESSVEHLRLLEPTAELTVMLVCHSTVSF